LARIILGSRGFKFVESKGISPLQEEIIAKEKKYTQNFEEKNSAKPLGQFYPGLAKSSLEGEDSSVFNGRGYSPSPRGDDSERVKIHTRFLKIFFSRTSMPKSINGGVI
jgi:hypothetical protein